MGGRGDVLHDTACHTGKGGEVERESSPFLTRGVDPKMCCSVVCHFVKRLVHFFDLTEPQ